MKETKKTENNVIIVSGPSGVGKSTICKEVVKRMKNVFLSVSVTTRERAEGEVDGVDYRYVSPQKFQEFVNKGLLLEHAEVFGNLYGTPKDKVEQALAEGKAVLLQIDVQGAKQVKQIYKDAVMIFILAPSHKELAERMKMRGREDDEKAQERLDEADDEIAAAWQYYQHMVINDDLESAIKEVIQIIEAARNK